METVPLDIHRFKSKKDASVSEEFALFNWSSVGQFFVIRASLSLFVPQVFFFRCYGKAVLIGYGISWYLRIYFLCSVFLLLVLSMYCLRFFGICLTILNHFHPELMKWTFPSLNLNIVIVANTNVSQKSNQSAKQCRS